MIKDGHSSSKLKTNLLYDSSTVIKTFIEATDNVISAFKEPVHLHQTLKRQKRQNLVPGLASLLYLFFTLDLFDGDGQKIGTTTDIDSFISSQDTELVNQQCSRFTTISEEKATFLTECDYASTDPTSPSFSFPIDTSCQLLADLG